MLAFQILREDILRQAEKVSSFQFISGESRTLAIQLLNGFNNKPYQVCAGYTVMIELPTADSQVSIFREMTKEDCDSSIWTVDLTTEETAKIISGTIIICLIEVENLDNEKVAAMQAVTYDADTGIVSVDDADDLSEVSTGMVFRDASSAEFIILGDIDNTVSQKQFKIEKGKTVDLSAGATIHKAEEVKKAMLKRALVKSKTGC